MTRDSLENSRPAARAALAIGPSTFRRELARTDDPRAVAGHKPGHFARRLMDGQEPAFTDPFLVFSEDWLPRGAFPLHPHRGVETVTFVLDGVLQHRDSDGRGGVVHPGDAQWTTAGRGIRHEETPAEGSLVHTLQLWVNLPASAKMTEPRHQNLIGGEMPVRREAGVEARVFSGRSGEAVSTTLNHAPVTMIEARIGPGHHYCPVNRRIDSIGYFL